MRCQQTAIARKSMLLNELLKSKVALSDAMQDGIVQLLWQALHADMTGNERKVFMCFFQRCMLEASLLRRCQQHRAFNDWMLTSDAKKACKVLPAPLIAYYVVLQAKSIAVRTLCKRLLTIMDHADQTDGEVLNAFISVIAAHNASAPRRAHGV